MAFIQMGIFSDVIGMATGVNVIMPENVAEPPAVLYLLHGLSDDQTMWSRRTSVERYADARGLAVVMPTTYRGFYTDMECGYKYWTYISEELPAKIQKIFNVSTAREKTFAAGLSMGGYGALKLGLRQPGRFAAVAGLSSAADVKSRVQATEEYKAVFGDEIKPENDLFTLADTFKNRTQDAPKIYMWCGTDDFLLNNNRRLSEYMKKTGLDITYSESAGGHEWRLWDEQIAKVINWLPL